MEFIKLTTKQAAEMDVVDLFKLLNTSEAGLFESESNKRIKLVGKNSLISEKEKSYLIEFLNNFTDPMIITLIIIAVISFATGQKVDGGIVVVMVLMSAILNFIQEFKASKAAAALKAKVAHKAMIYRHGRQIEIDAESLVPGDIIEVNAGDVVQADARVFEIDDCFVNQSSLTGESFPQLKTTNIEGESKSVNDLSNLIFAGTSVVTGIAKAVVVKTGVSTEIGQISQTLNQEQEDDAFTRELAKFSKFMIKVIVVLVSVIFLIKAATAGSLLLSLSFAVAVAVGLTPEFLPMIMSVTMGRGAVAMSKVGVIVKHLTAIPSLGSMDVLCTDKTGTLTANRIEIVEHVDVFGKKSDQALKMAYLNSFFQGGIVNPMDDALKELDGISHKGYKKHNEFPFDFERRRLSITVEKDDAFTLITKGAPESVFNVLSGYYDQDKVRKFTPSVRVAYEQTVERLSLNGYRVLAIATREVNVAELSLKHPAETNLTLVGFIAFFDPPKKGMQQALDQLNQLNIRLKVISGDNELVNQFVCKKLNIPIQGVLLGEAIDFMSEEELANSVETTTIFARVNPDQKMKIINALKAKGHSVGYVGDGVNDAPPLLAADVGISVSNAVDVAREAADCVLTHKNLTELVNGVKEGRKTFGNTMKYILMGMSSNFGNMVSMMGAAIFLPFLPMMPVQILLNNFLYDISQVTIPTDNVDPEYLERPRTLDLSKIKKYMMVFGLISTVFDLVTFGVLYLLHSTTPSLFQSGWFVESLSTQALVIFIIRTERVPFLSRPSIWVIVSAILAVSAAWLIPMSGVGRLFDFSPLPVKTGLILFAIVATYLFTVTMVQAKIRKLAEQSDKLAR